MIETNSQDVVNLEQRCLLEKILVELFQLDISNTKKFLLKISSIYAAMALLWIIVYVIILRVLSSGSHEIMFISTIKGILYILLTGMLFYIFAYFSIKKLSTIYNNRYKECERKLHKLEYHDKLTGLYTGKNKMIFYNKQMNEAVTERMNIEKISVLP